MDYAYGWTPTFEAATIRRREQAKNKKARAAERRRAEKALMKDAKKATAAAAWIKKHADRPMRIKAPTEIKPVRPAKPRTKTVSATIEYAYGWTPAFEAATLKRRKNAKSRAAKARAKQSAVEKRKETRIRKQARDTNRWLRKEQAAQAARQEQQELQRLDSGAKNKFNLTNDTS